MRDLVLGTCRGLIHYPRQSYQRTTRSRKVSETRPSQIPVLHQNYGKIKRESGDERETTKLFRVEKINRHRGRSVMMDTESHNPVRLRNLLLRPWQICWISVNSLELYFLHSPPKSVHKSNQRLSDKK